MKQLVIPIFIPHMGCPHTCTFCNQKKIAGDYQRPTGLLVKELVELYTSTVKAKNPLVEVAFYGGSFTGLEVSLQEELLASAYNLKEKGKIHKIRLSTRPDYICPRVIERLNRYQVDTVELGVQSLDKEVLSLSQRGHSEDEVFQAVRLLKDRDIQVGIQLMPGLPGDTFKKTIETTSKVVGLRPAFVRIYPTIIIKETQLNDLYQAGKFKPLELEEAVEISAQMLIILERSNIPVIRIGLQAQENLAPGQDFIAGPYHPALGELVKARVFRKQLEYLLREGGISPLTGEVAVLCHPHQISQVKGQHHSNIKYFKEKYKLSIEIVSEPSLSLGFLGLRDKINNHFLVLSRREFLDKYRI